MSLYDVHALGFQITQALLGDDCPTFQWRNQAWKIVPDSVHLEKSHRQGGFAYDTPHSLVFHADRTQFDGNEPGPQQEIGYLEREYQIQTKQLLPGGLLIRYVCSDKYVGAGG